MRGRFSRETWREAAEQTAEREVLATAQQDELDLLTLALEPGATVREIVGRVHEACHVFGPAQLDTDHDRLAMQCWITSVLEAGWRMAARSDW